LKMNTLEETKVEFIERGFLERREKETTVH
jgi:hypothetical protein